MKLLSFGEILFDVFTDNSHIGGAPLNFAAHAAKQGADAWIVSAVGNLKIVKSSSDGRGEGFSFRVTGENYDEVFKTDANGEIFIEGLRIGKYTVTEVEDEVSAGYMRPDPVEVELVADETLTVNVHNDKITIEEPPKTGDNSNMGLWFGLLMLSCLGMVGTVIYGRRRRREDAEV